MFVLVIGMRAKEGSDDALVAALATAARASRPEPGCIAFDVFRDTEDPREVVLVEKYVDAAGFDAHKETAHFAEAMSVLPDLVESRTMRIMDDAAPA